MQLRTSPLQPVKAELPAFRAEISDIAVVSGGANGHELAAALPALRLRVLR